MVAPLRRDYRVLRAAAGGAAAEVLMKEEVDVVITEIALPDMTGVELLQLDARQLSADGGDPHLVGGERRRGGPGHQARGLSLPRQAGDRPRASARSSALAEERAELNRRVLRLEDQVGDAGQREFVAGPSAALRDVLETAQKVARTDATVLILGESGTGKELLARRVHRDSEHADGPFVAVNMAAIPRDLVESHLFGHEKGSFTGAVQQRIGKFELASGGTLFLDEIGDLPLDLQAKLLRAIQEQEIERVGGDRPIPTSFRLIAATNVDLEQAVKQGHVPARISTTA